MTSVKPQWFALDGNAAWMCSCVSYLDNSVGKELCVVTGENISTWGYQGPTIKSEGFCVWTECLSDDVQEEK